MRKLLNSILRKPPFSLNQICFSFEVASYRQTSSTPLPDYNSSNPVMGYSSVPNHEPEVGSDNFSTDSKHQSRFWPRANFSPSSEPNRLNLYVAVTSTLLCVLLISDKITGYTDTRNCRANQPLYDLVRSKTPYNADKED